VKPYVEERIRRPVPPGCCVVPNSTPVVAFGNPETARVATLGLNPSRQEFLDTKGNPLVGADQRFETLVSIGYPSLARAPLSAVERVFHGCRDYFHRKPYTRWFNQLEAVLQRLGRSYYDGSACHLDISQWATDPVWGRLDPAIRARLAREDGGFLLQQLTSEHYDALLLNGRGVANELRKIARRQLAWRPTDFRFGSKIVEVAQGEYAGVRILAWNCNFQSSFGVSNALRAGIAELVAEQLR
jgi:hypothetical protein